MYIVFEGLDGAGKTTQLERLKTFFEAQGKEVVVTREPGGTKIGEQLRALIKSTNVSTMTREMLFQADRAETIATIVYPALEAGKVVISDRSFLTGLAYTNFDIDMMIRLSNFVTSGVKPDVVIIPEVSEDVFISRVLSRDGELDVIEVEVAKNAIEIQRKIENFSRMNTKNVLVLNGNAGVDEVYEEMISKLCLK